jgi:hypothetical protein
MYIFFMQLVSKVKTKQSLKGRVMWLGGVKGGCSGWRDVFYELRYLVLIHYFF